MREMGRRQRNALGAAGLVAALGLLASMGTPCDGEGDYVDEDELQDPFDVADSDSVSQQVATQWNQTAAQSNAALDALPPCAGVSPTKPPIAECNGEPLPPKTPVKWDWPPEPDPPADPTKKGFSGRIFKPGFQNQATEAFPDGVTECGCWVQGRGGWYPAKDGCTPSNACEPTREQVDYLDCEGNQRSSVEEFHCDPKNDCKNDTVRVGRPGAACFMWIADTSAGCCEWKKSPSCNYIYDQPPITVQCETVDQQARDGFEQFGCELSPGYLPCSGSCPKKATLDSANSCQRAQVEDTDGADRGKCGPSLSFVESVLGIDSPSISSNGSNQKTRQGAPTGSTGSTGSNGTMGPCRTGTGGNGSTGSTGSTGGSCLPEGSACSGVTGSTYCCGNSVCESGRCVKRCLVEGTQITLADGSKKTIEQLSESDQLLSMGENGALSMSSIGEIVSSTAPGYLEVVTSHGTVRATGTHPFYTGSDLKNGRDSQFRPLSDFKVGEYLVIREGDGLRRVEIRAIRKVDRPTRVFNLHNVQGPHTFIADDYVVHNK